MKKEEIKISKSGFIGDGRIKSIILLERNKERGYALQNELLPNNWIEITFKDDEIIKGYIIDLEDDIIQVKIENEIIYIDFEYKGLPEGIKKIEKIESPIIIDAKIEEEDEEQEDVIFEKEMDIELIYENVNKKMYRYSLEDQLNDLMNNFLIKKMDNAHLLVSRFKQLRDKTGEFDENENIIGIKYEANSLLMDNLLYFNTPKLYWIQYVAKAKRDIYVYHNEMNELEEGDYMDIELIDIIENRRETVIKQDQLGSKSTGSDLKYKSYFENLHTTPFSE